MLKSGLVEYEIVEFEKKYFYLVNSEFLSIIVKRLLLCNYEDSIRINSEFLI